MLNYRFKCVVSLLISSMCATSIAAEQPKPEDLVGKVYGGIHGLHIKMDNDRLTTESPSSYMDYGVGIGGEVGYRWLPSTEFRLSYSQFDLKAANSTFEEPDGSSTSVDVLYFPTEKNFYLLTGVNNLDIQQSQISGNFGAGYRHYLSERTALYFESKYNYQFSERYDELTSQIGFVYFFGDTQKSQPSTAAIVAPLDTDKDGVNDNNDNCPGTPMNDKVDINGCTVFVDEVITKQLLVKFDHNKAEIKSEFNSPIEAMAKFMKANPNLSLSIEGHSSSPGSNQYNKTLSQKRSNAIIKVLQSKHGISASRLSAVGYGEERLLNSANTAAAHAENRRIMAKIEITKKVAVKR